MEEVEEAFRHYWQVGAAGEDWGAWADLFTDDAVYREHILGHMKGRDEIKRWITSIMATVPELYTFYEWHTIDGDRVVFYMQNRRDNPEPGGAPIDFPGITVLEYAGDGKWRLEEDFWALPAARRAQTRYEELCAEHDPGHPDKMTRGNWPAAPEWARGAAVGPSPRG